MKNIIILLLIISSTVFSQTAISQTAISGSLLLRNDAERIEKSSPRQLPITATEKAPSKKSGALAVLYSLVLPGMGELYAGSYETGKYFTIAEGVIWGVFIGYNTYGNWQRDNYKAFASSKAGVNSSGKDADYYANLGDYVSLEEYNRRMGLNGEFNKQYNDQVQYNWNWKTESQLREYRKMWVSSEQSFNNIRFAVGALIVNRLVSAFNAARLARSYNKNLENTETGWNMSVGFDPSPNATSSMSLNFQTRF